MKQTRTSTSSHALLDEYTQQSGIARLSTSMQINTYFLDYIILVISCAWAVVASITSRSRSYVQRSRLHPALPMKPSSFQAIKPSSFQAFKLSPRAFDLVGLIGIAKTKTSWKGGMGCKQTALHTFCIHIAKERLQKLQRDSTPLDSPDLLSLYSPPNISSVYKPIYAHLQGSPHNLHHFMHLISAPSSMP